MYLNGIFDAIEDAGEQFEIAGREGGSVLLGGHCW